MFYTQIAQLCIYCVVFYTQVRNALTDAAKKAAVEDTPSAMFAFLIERVRANLHIVLGMSPVGEPFRCVGSS